MKKQIMKALQDSCALYTPDDVDIIQKALEEDSNTSEPISIRVARIIANKSNELDVSYAEQCIFVCAEAAFPGSNSEMYYTSIDTEEFSIVDDNDEIDAQYIWEVMQEEFELPYSVRLISMRLMEYDEYQTLCNGIYYDDVKDVIVEN